MFSKVKRGLYGTLYLKMNDVLLLSHDVRVIDNDVVLITNGGRVSKKVSNNLEKKVNK